MTDSKPLFGQDTPPLRGYLGYRNTVLSGPVVSNYAHWYKSKIEDTPNVVVRYISDKKYYTGRVFRDIPEYFTGGGTSDAWIVNEEVLLSLGLPVRESEKSSNEYYYYGGGRFDEVYRNELRTNNMHPITLAQQEELIDKHRKNILRRNGRAGKCPNTNVKINPVILQNIMVHEGQFSKYSKKTGNVLVKNYASKVQQHGATLVDELALIESGIPVREMFTKDSSVTRFYAYMGFGNFCGVFEDYLHSQYIPFRTLERYNEDIEALRKANRYRAARELS